jgi:hypothetical protein
MDNDETLLRRARLRELIDVSFNGKLVDLATHMEKVSGDRVNQAELSSLRKDHGPKSFGDKKAKVLTEQIGLHRHWFSMPLGTALERRQWLSAASSQDPALSMQVIDALQDWRLKASSKSQEVIDQLTLLAKKNKLRDEDWLLIEHMVQRFVQK